MEKLCFNKNYFKVFDFHGRADDIFEVFKGERCAFFLDSSLQFKNFGRFSFIGFDPAFVVRDENDFSLGNLRKVFDEHKTQTKNPYSPLTSGFVGALSFDFGLNFENIPSQKDEDVKFPGYHFGFYDSILTIDHESQKLIIFSTYKSKLADIERRLKSYEPRNNPPQNISDVDEPLSFSCSFTKEKYFKTFQKALRYIRAGDIYQVNLAQRFLLAIEKDIHVQPLEIYKILRELSPSCFGGYLDAGDFKILSSSPENFLSLRNRHVTTRPMKGTRPRAKNKIEDEILLKDLSSCPKDIAELLMITDLERSDLGRVCEFGSVRVKEKRTIESYSTVFQATSTVEGMLQKNKDCFDLIKACFPGGSIAGCPKIRSLKIIDELEPVRRGFYTGALGYISSSGDMDFNILIRTLFLKDNQISFHAGSGIVADSTQEEEYAETLVKAKAMQETLARYFSSLGVCA